MKHASLKKGTSVKQFTQKYLRILSMKPAVDNAKQNIKHKKHMPNISEETFYADNLQHCNETGIRHST